MTTRKERGKTYTILYTTSFSTMAGGGQWSLYYLIKYLDKERFRPIVLCPEAGELAEKMKAVGAEVVFLKTARISSLSPVTVRKFISIIKERRIALIHTDSTTETFYAGIAAKIMRVPLVWHIRVSDGERFLDRALSCLSTKVVLVAGALGKRFPWFTEDRAPIIYNGIDLQEFDSFRASSVRKEFKIDHETVLLGCNGRLEERKGQEYLIRALKNTGRSKVILAGGADESYLQRLRQLCAGLGLSDRVIFAGHRRDIPSLLREIDIFVFPVVSGEGFSRAVLEAMAAGKPVIASDDAGNPEAVTDGETGYIVNTKDADALADRINDLIRNKEKREQMGRAGRHKLENMFTVQRYVELVEQLYHATLVSPKISCTL